MRRLSRNVADWFPTEKALARSTKIRVNEYLRDRFKPLGNEKKPVGKDKAVRNLAYSYALNPVEFEKVEQHLQDVDYGPRDIHGSHEKTLEIFTGQHAADFTWCRYYRDAVERVIKDTKPSKPLQILKFNSDFEIKDAIPREDTHAGFSYLLTGNRKKGAYMEDIRRKLEVEETVAISNKSYNKPILIGERYQCSGGYTEDGIEIDEVKYKKRTVCMVDIYQILTELRFAKGAQKHIGTLDMYAGGKVPNQLFQIVTRNRFATDRWVSIDYSHYDQSLPSWLLRAAFRVVRSWFSEFTERESKLWDIIVNDFINKGFVGPKGEIVYACDGLPSGSMFTQIIGTLCNRIMMQTFAYHMNYDRPIRTIICSDDNLLFYDNWFDLDQYASYIMHNFGIEISVQKCSSGTRYGSNPEFLSRFWTTTGIYRDPRILLAKMMYPERFRDYKKNKQLKPELIFYSYYLAYGEGMRVFFNIDKFLRDHGNLLKSLSVEDLEQLSGYYRYLVRYEKYDALQLVA